MKAESIKICNYKSLGESKNELILNNGATVIVGKNQSGKTNIIEAFGEFDFSRVPYAIPHIERKTNRLTSGGIQIRIRIERNKIFSETEMRIDKDSLCVLGGIASAALKDGDIIECLNSLAASGGRFREFAYKYADNFSKNPYKLLEDICAASTQTMMACPENGDKEQKAAVGCGKKERDYADITDKERNVFARLGERTAEYVNELPFIFFYANGKKNDFRDYYYADDIISMSKDDIFSKLLEVVGVSRGTLCRIMDGRGAAGREILRVGLASVAERFRAFSSRTFSLDFNLQSGRLCLMSARSGKRNKQSSGRGQASAGCCPLDELPVADKWLFGLFVDMLWRKIRNKNIVFVFDQPGVFMHVDAQKELLKMFNRIAGLGHQIVYTTHSPFLLDTDNIGSMRAVEKKDGRTEIYNKIYSNEISDGSKLETLTPVFAALGAGFSVSRISDDRRLNIIVEGISDYYYIKGMMHLLLKEEQPYVLPAVGAPNVGNVATILIGWGLPLKVIVDYDEEGRRAAEKMKDKLGLVSGEDIFYINGKTVYSGEEICRIEDMFSLADRQKIRQSCGRQAKAIVSRTFYDMVQEGKIVPERETVRRFGLLFGKLGLTDKTYPE